MNVTRSSAIDFSRFRFVPWPADVPQTSRTAALDHQSYFCLYRHSRRSPQTESSFRRPETNAASVESAAADLERSSESNYEVNEREDRASGTPGREEGSRGTKREGEGPTRAVSLEHGRRVALNTPATVQLGSTPVETVPVCLAVSRRRHRAVNSASDTRASANSAT